MGIFDEYVDYLSKYQAIYGPQTVVLFQNGGFFEAYGVDNNVEKIGLAKEVSEMINVQLARRDKAILENDRKNFLFAGFPVSNLDRYVSILTEEHNYVVVIVEQVAPAPHPKREVTNIVSPGANITHLTNPHNNYLLSIYIEHESTKMTSIKFNDILTIGLAAIDVSTGKCYTYQITNLINDQNRAFDETNRFILNLQPKEILINTRNYKTTKEQLISLFEINHCLVHCQLDAISSEIYKLNYQNTFLGQVFKQTGFLSPIEYIDMERYPTALIAYVILLDFCHKLKETIVDQISPPTIWNPTNQLILDNTCISQLNLTSLNTQKISSIFNLIDHTSTSMGKRLLKKTLLLPLTEPTQIEEKYNWIELLRQIQPSNSFKHLQGHKNSYLFQKYEVHLNQISDIERLHRKMSVGILHPCEINQLDSSYKEILTVIDLIMTDAQSHQLFLKILQPPNLKIELENYINYYTNIINLTESYKYNTNNINSSFLKNGFNAEIDTIQEQLNECHQYFKQLSTQISLIITPTPEKPVVSCKYSNKTGYHLEITTARWKTFCSKFKQPITITPHNKTYIIQPGSLGIIPNPSGKNGEISSNEIKYMCKLLESTQELISKKIFEVYKQFLNSTYQSYNHTMKQLVSFVSHLDVHKSNAKTSLLYNYCRPQIANVTNNRSFLKATQIRHPIIEQIQSDCPYIPQDITLDENQCGIVLFSVNKGGKCYDPQTPILMHSGEVKPCSAIQINDKLMGDDSNPRIVLSITHGFGEMYDVIPLVGDSFKVNGPHILVLYHTGQKTLIKNQDHLIVKWIDDQHQIRHKLFPLIAGEHSVVFQIANTFLDNLPDYSGIILETTVEKYLQISDQFWQSNYHLYHVGIEFEDKLTDIDPQLIGYQLGSLDLHNPDPVHSRQLLEYISKYGRSISSDYLINSRTNRLKLLAGLVESCYCNRREQQLELIVGSRRLANDVCYLSRSLGYLAHISKCIENPNNHLIIIESDNLCDILTRNSESNVIQIHQKFPHTPFIIKTCGVGPYCGFQLDQNQRHLLWDFTVVHNSSLMRTIGTTVAMAQAGMYVPAQKFIYYPYHSIMTRITSNDNLFKGLSSFEIEMIELRGILKRADSYSLILGDEICHGTETDSGVALVASSIITLSKKKANFLFATHLHALSRMNRINQLENVKMLHLSVIFDENTGNLIYDRQLKPGPGSPLYGLEVAKAMELDHEFIQLANEIRKEHMNFNEILPEKKSRYNSNLYVNHCGIPDCNNQAESTHHIKFQSDSDSSGFIGHVQKNHKSNLIPLCHQCHSMLHDFLPGHWRYIIKGYVLTSDGVKLDYEKIQNPAKKKLLVKSKCTQVTHISN